MLKIGFCNFWGCDKHLYNFFEIDNFFLKAFRDYNVEYELLNPFLNECDIVIKSVYNIENFEQIKGHPIIIGYTGEPMKYFGNVHYSLTFDDDTDANLYYPLWQINSDRYYNNLPVKKVEEKDLFCTFITRNGFCQKRNEIFDYISQNYKIVSSVGIYKNNMNYKLPDYQSDFKACQDFHRRYKFNLCFENTPSSGNTSYITEKIIHAYAYGTVPIYWGAENITKWFNPDSFINCNGLSNEEILDKIIELDNDDKKYMEMLYANPFIYNINWKKYANERLISFLRNKNLIK